MCLCVRVCARVCVYGHVAYSLLSGEEGLVLKCQRSESGGCGVPLSLGVVSGQDKWLVVRETTWPHLLLAESEADNNAGEAEARCCLVLLTSSVSFS